MMPFPSRKLEATAWMWVIRKVERMEVNLKWLVQFKMQTSTSVTSGADAESTDGVRGLSRCAGAPSKTWLQAEAGIPLKRLKEGVVTALCKVGKGPNSFSSRVWMCYEGLGSAWCPSGV